MAEVIDNHPLVGLASDAQQLAVALQTIGACSWSDVNQRDCQRIVGIISVCGGVLTCLEETITARDSPTSHPAVLTEAGRSELMDLAARMRAVIQAVIIVFNVASKEEEKKKKKKKKKPKIYTSNRPALGRRERRPRRRYRDYGESERHLPANLMDFRVLEGTKLTCGRFDWDWLDVMMRILIDYAEWIQGQLLLFKYIVELAHFQLRTSIRAPGAFSEEQALQSLIGRLASKNARQARLMMNNYEEAETTVETLASKSKEESLPVPEPEAHPPSTTLPVATEAAPPVLDKADDKITTPVKPLQCNADDNASSGEWSELDGVPPKPDQRGAAEREEAGRQSEAQPLAEITAEEPRHADAPEEPPPPEESVIKLPAVETTAVEATSRSRLPGWIRNFFIGGRTRLPRPTSEPDMRLEAFFIDENNRGLAYLIPFTPAEITLGYQQACASNITVWDAYMRLKPRRRYDLHLAITRVKQRDARERNVVAIVVQPASEGSENPAILLYVSVGDEVEPVYIIDQNGRRLIVPYEHCRNWGRLTRTFSHSNASTLVSRNALDFTHNGFVIPSQTWESTVKPGMTIEIRDCRSAQRFLLSSQLDPPLGSLPPGFGAPPPAPAPRPVNIGLPPALPTPPELRHPGVAPTPGGREVLKWVKGTEQIDDVSSSDSGEEEETQASELRRLGLEFDWRAELDKAKARPEEMLKKWTNAPDTDLEFDLYYLTPSDSDTDSTYDS